MWKVKNSSIHNRGVFATKTIAKNTKIIEYIGEKISKKEGDLRSEKRLKKYLKSKKTGSVYIFNATLKAGTTSKDFFEIFDQKVLRAIDKFKPEVILISAGFDAHVRDPLANINLESEDFFKITKNIVDIANIHSKGRVISFLEGGYDLQALSESIIEHLKALKSHI